MRRVGTVTVEGEVGEWRVDRIALDETPTASLTRRIDIGVADDDGPVRPGEGAEPVGRPFVRILDLPGLPGSETETRPIGVLAVDPWRPMAIHVGETVDALTRRGLVETPATVGRLVQALGAGPVDRWDEIQTVVVALEGEAPVSVGPEAALAGGTLLAVETTLGWELVSFAEAQAVGPGLWRLRRLLRGRQGTEAEAAIGAAVGAVVVVLDDRTARFDLGPAERGLERVARVGPVGAAPGGAGFTQIGFRFEGAFARPWSPAGLTVSSGDVGNTIRWLPRVRVGGDRWDLEPVEVDPRRFRVRILDGTVERRVFEVEGLEGVYAAADLATDFPGGPGSEARVAVAQYGADWGWGREAVCRLAG